ncbi:hypothetical protein BDBG_17612 [Blastomyces gilchristii SLH14081]|uniref:Uncharacterized protein n=1 Tax=Blastomyces gilchristii (strain SLH14081) TaxID=559298 RepID=A0A179UY29_BLAGS|nr:uncharacterized protein BDBG_17612 [Blastomyces gilchristii SLH14081]OAT12017.1 hypothetical protein BDBG_17612 [Blastomyces gilchristii SLH14081]
MQNLSESLLKAVRKAAETAELESKLCTCTRILNEIEALCTQWQAEVKAKQQLTFAADQASTMKSFADAIATINKNRENQILGLQREIEHLHRQVTTHDEIYVNYEMPREILTDNSANLVEEATNRKMKHLNEILSNMLMKYLVSKPTRL